MRGFRYEVNNDFRSDAFGGFLLAFWWAPYFVFSLASHWYDATRSRMSSWCCLYVRQRTRTLYERSYLGEN